MTEAHNEIDVVKLLMEHEGRISRIEGAIEELSKRVDMVVKLQIATLGGVFAILLAVIGIFAKVS